MVNRKPAGKRKTKQRDPTPARPKTGSTAPAAPANSHSLRQRITTPLEENSDENLPVFAIAGIGASAGGLEALGQLLGGLPEDPQLALVIVQHMDPRHESVLAHLLAESTELPVLEVQNGMVVECNHVYVVPPNKEMGIVDGQLHLMPRPNNRTQFNPIDFFFHSLAEYAQSRAIGVVLSGTASDGATGLREIASGGGIVIAQDPKTAKFDGMPRAAIATGVVDLVLPAGKIAPELARIGRQLGNGKDCGVGTSTVDASADNIPNSAQYASIFVLLRKACGVDFTHYKQPTIRRRLQRRMLLHKVQGIEQYLRLLEQTPAEVTQLYQDILIHVTRFFRDYESFAALEATVFPQIVNAASENNPIRVWIPGCSTGEEAYSVAISLLEYLGEKAPDMQIQIFGTDVSEATIEQARTGIYPESISADIAPERLRRFFTRVDGHYRINKNVRDLCIFARQDLTRDPPFSKLDLIVCRNVLIYFDSMLQKKLMQVFHYALRPDGFLMLGSAETIGFNSDVFAVADKKHKIYTKKIGDRGARGVEFMSAQAPAVRTAPRPFTHDLLKTASGVQNEANRIILSRYSPAGVIVDSDLKIVQFRGQTGDFLEPAPGEASLSLLKMAREGLLHGLRTAIHESRKKDAAVRKEGLRVRIGGRMRDVGMEVIPIATAEGRHFLILFHDRTATSADSAADGQTAPAPERAEASRSAKSKSVPDEQRFAHLRQELAASREYLQSIIQDMEAANEELQSANEEILSSNEELQSTNEELDTAKEELQSTNEELNTVNEELQGRNEELSRANSDLVNLLGSVQIAIVMVAGDLRIRRFTPMAEKVLNLIPGDVGRPISDIKPNINCPQLEQLIMESVDTVMIKECEAQDRLGNWYLVRIRPYKNVENRIDGAVIALFDVDSNRRVRINPAIAPEAIGALTEASDEPTLVLDAEQVVRAANAAFAKWMRAKDVIGRSIFDLPGDKWNEEDLKRALTELAQREGWEAGAAHDGNGRDEGGIRPSVRARRQLIGGDPVTVVVFDVPPEKQA